MGKRPQHYDRISSSRQASNLFEDKIYLRTFPKIKIEQIRNAIKTILIDLNA